MPQHSAALAVANLVATESSAALAMANLVATESGRNGDGRNRKESRLKAELRTVSIELAGVPEKWESAKFPFWFTAPPVIE